MKEEKVYIVSISERDSITGERLYWSNQYGWTDKGHADRFTKTEAENARLVGQWEVWNADDTEEDTAFMEPEDFEAFWQGYIETALWATTDQSDDSGGRPLDENYGEDDLDEATRNQMRDDCLSFLTQMSQYIPIERYKDAGGDFWLTRERHGAGFWDGDWPKETARLLTDASHAFGSYCLYVAEGKVHGN